VIVRAIEPTEFERLGQLTVAAYRAFPDERMGFVRRPDLDWQPVPSVPLWGFSLEL